VARSQPPLTSFFFSSGLVSRNHFEQRRYVSSEESGAGARTAPRAGHRSYRQGERRASVGGLLSLPPARRRGARAHGTARPRL